MNTSSKENLLTISRVANAIKTCGYLIAFVQILFTQFSSFTHLCMYVFARCSSWLICKRARVSLVCPLKTSKRYLYRKNLLFIAFNACFVVEQFSESFQCLSSLQSVNSTSSFILIHLFFFHSASVFLSVSLCYA